MIKQCLVCNKDFVTYPSEIKLGGGKYCSKACYSTTQQVSRIKFTCKCCGSEFGLTNSYMDRSKKYGKDRGQYCSNKCRMDYRQLKKSVGNINGYPVYVSKTGYLYFWQNGKNIYLHRYLMEQHLGVVLPKTVVVHHRNECKSDNRIENFEVLSRVGHRIAHCKLNIINAGGDPNTQSLCNNCHKIKPLSCFSQQKTRWNGVSHRCKECMSMLHKNRRSRSKATLTSTSDLTF